MLENPDLPSLLPDKAMKRIDARLRTGGFRTARRIRRAGFDNFQRDYRRTLPSSLTSEMRSLVNTYHDPTITDDGKERLDPRSFAALQGFTVGLCFAQEALANETVFGFFTKRIEGQFRSLRRTLAESPYDLKDMVSQTGNQFSGTLAEITDLEIQDDPSVMESLDEVDRHNILSDAFGYIGAAALIKLAENHIKRTQPLDRKAIGDMGYDLYVLQDPRTQITTVDFD